MYKKIVSYIVYLRDKRRSKNLDLRQTLEKKVEDLERLVELYLQLVQALMAEYGINGLPADMAEREKLLKKYPDLQEAHNKLYAAATEAGRITMANPWLWKPGEDVGNYYDIGAVQDRMIAIANSEAEYLDYLDKRHKELEDQIKKSPDNQDLINEQNYVKKLMEDQRATIGDKMIEIWWNAIPRIIKEKYVKYMDDLMICALGSNELLSGVVKTYDKLHDEEREYICTAFITILTQDLNNTVFKDCPIPLCVYSNHDDTLSGFNLIQGKDEVVVFNVANIGKRVDKMVGTIKHEILGHYVDNHCTNMGLEGDAMRQFISENIANYNGEIFCHGHIEFEPEVVVISPLLKQQYRLDGLNWLKEKELKVVDDTLGKYGWRLAYYYGGERNRDYKNIMTERSAWLIDELTNDVIRKIEAYRAAHGLPHIGKVNIIR